MPSAIALAGAEVELAPIEGRERRLARLLVRDRRATTTTSSWTARRRSGCLTVNALTAADSVLIPLQCEYYALEGLTQLLATLDLIRDHLNPASTIKGVVLTMYDGRTNLSADVAAEVRRHLGDRVFETVIPRSVRLSEAPSHGLPISRYAPDSTGAVAYAALADELRARDGRDESDARPARRAVQRSRWWRRDRPTRSVRRAWVAGSRRSSRSAAPASPAPSRSRRRGSARTRTSPGSASIPRDWRR